MCITSLFSHNFLVSTLLTWKFVGLSAWNYCQILSSNCLRIWQVRCHSDVLICSLSLCASLLAVSLWEQCGYRGYSTVLSGLYTQLCDIGVGLLYILGAMSWSKLKSRRFSLLRRLSHDFLVGKPSSHYADNDYVTCICFLLLHEWWKYVLMQTEYGVMSSVIALLTDNVWKWYCLYSI